MSESRLFKPVKLGAIQLGHRVGMCPLTRYHASDDHVPTPAMQEYYAQRASVPGTLIVSEATFIAPAHSGFENVPGIYSDAQVAAWRTITDAVHAHGSVIVCQLWALGRAAKPAVLAREGFPVISASDIPIDPSSSSAPAPMTVDQIRQTVADYAEAARNAVLRAGFDGVEIHAANGYLIDQFTQDVSNNRTDDYGGSIAARSRFAVEVTTAVAEAVGPHRTGIRFSPWGRYQAMRMADPVPQFTDLLRRLGDLGSLAFVHLVEGRISGNTDIESDDVLDFAYDAWRGPLLIAGGYKPDSACRLVDETHPNRDVVVMFGRDFISNPDLPYRVREGIPFTPYHRDTFYLRDSLHGYTDYPFSQKFLDSGAQVLT